MEDAINVLLSPKSNEGERNKARRALFRGLLADFAKEQSKSVNAMPEAVRGQNKH